jgi:hypothetical protein
MTPRVWALVCAVLVAACVAAELALVAFLLLVDALGWVWDRLTGGPARASKEDAWLRRD